MTDVLVVYYYYYVIINLFIGITIYIIQIHNNNNSLKR